MKQSHTLGIAIGLFILLVGPQMTNAQGYTLEPESKVLVGTAPPDELSAFDFYFVNITDKPLSLAWKPVHNGFSGEWDYSVCDYGHCYAGLPSEGGMMDSLMPGKQGFMAMNITPYASAKPSTVKIYMYRTDSPNTGDTLTWFINPATSNVSDDLKPTLLVQVYPSVVSTVLTCKSESSPIESIEIFAVSGSLVLRQSGNRTTSQQIDIAGLSDGMYFVSIVTGNGRHAMRKVEVSR